MCIDHCRLDALVPQDLLDRPDVVAVLEEMGCEARFHPLRSFASLRRTGTVSGGQERQALRRTEVCQEPPVARLCSMIIEVQEDGAPMCGAMRGHSPTRVRPVPRGRGKGQVAGVLLGREPTVEARRSGTSGSPDLEVGPRSGMGGSPHLKVGLRSGASGSPRLKVRSPAGASGLRSGTSRSPRGASGSPRSKVGPPAGTGRSPRGASGSPELKVDSPAGTSGSPASKVLLLTGTNGSPGRTNGL
jgi:hypothetical protein